MKIGDEVTIEVGGKIRDREITYADAEKSCGCVTITPKYELDGTIVGFKEGWFSSYWIVSLDNGKIVKVRA